MGGGFKFETAERRLERPVDQEGEQREDVACILSRNMGFCNAKKSNSSWGVISIEVFISVF